LLATHNWLSSLISKSPALLTISKTPPPFGFAQGGLEPAERPEAGPVDIKKKYQITSTLARSFGDDECLGFG